MSVPFESIAESFGTVRTFLLRDLKLLVELPEGGNYAAALLTISACEALGMVRYGREHAGCAFFAAYLLPEPWQPAAPDLFDALRHGLAHSYETKALLQLEGGPVELVVSWRECPHLSYNADRRRLFVNVQSLFAALKSAIDRYESELRGDPTLRERFVKWSRRGREVHIPEGRRKLWASLLADAQPCAS